MFDKEKTLCFTGHRKLPKGKDFDILYKQLSDEIEKSLECGYNTFLFGAAIGWDMLCGKILLDRKKMIPLHNYKPFRVIAVVPFEEQAVEFSEKDHELYYDILSKCDEVITLNVRYTSTSYKERNQFMIDNSNQVICYYNGSFRSGTGQTVRMAEKQKLNIVNLY